MRALWRSDEMGRGESEGDVSAKLSSSAGMNAQLRRWTPCAASDCAQQAAGGEWQHMRPKTCRELSQFLDLLDRHARMAPALREAPALRGWEARARAQNGSGALAVADLEDTSCSVPPTPNVCLRNLWWRRCRLFAHGQRGHAELSPANLGFCERKGLDLEGLYCELIHGDESQRSPLLSAMRTLQLEGFAIYGE